MRPYAPCPMRDSIPALHTSVLKLYIAAVLISHHMQILSCTQLCLETDEYRRLQSTVRCHVRLGTNKKESETLEIIEHVHNVLRSNLLHTDLQFHRASACGLHAQRDIVTPPPHRAEE